MRTRVQWFTPIVYVQIHQVYTVLARVSRHLGVSHPRVFCHPLPLLRGKYLTTGVFARKNTVENAFNFR